jgi:hypothetical protein
MMLSLSVVSTVVASPTLRVGEVSPSYGDGGVMGHMIHDPSVRFADTSPTTTLGRT